MSSPTFQFYAQDFLTGCTYLTNEEIGMYIKMLCKQWTDGNIPKKRIGFLLGIEWVSISDELKSKFIDDGDFLINERLEIEREKQRKFKEKQAENGKKGGRPKKSDTAESLVNVEDKTQTKPKQKPKESQEKNLKEVVEKQIETSLKIPIDFIPIWEDWLEYRKAKKKKPYAGLKWEQVALDKFIENSKNNAEIGRQILNKTIVKNWEGLFELEDFKTVTNGKPTNTSDTNKPVAGRQSAETIAKNLSGWE